MPYHPRPISSLGPKGPLDDTAYDTDFAMYYSLFKEINNVLHPIFNFFFLIVKLTTLVTLLNAKKLYTEMRHILY